jgi:hypothetical protein
VADWDQRLHEHLAIEWPCPTCTEFGELWSENVRALTSTGMRFGPMSFGPYNDGDAGLVRAVWSLIRHLRAELGGRDWRRARFYFAVHSPSACQATEPGAYGASICRRSILVYANNQLNPCGPPSGRSFYFYFVPLLPLRGAACPQRGFESENRRAVFRI